MQPILIPFLKFLDQNKVVNFLFTNYFFHLHTNVKFVAIFCTTIINTVCGSFKIILKRILEYLTEECIQT